MRADALPSPGSINCSQELRSCAAQAISYCEIVAARSPESESLADLAAFFTACAAACVVEE